MALGRALRELRERRALPQQAVGYDARLCRNYLTMAERGQLNPSFVTLLWIVRTLGFTIAELVEIYDRHIAEIDPQAGTEVPRCPTPEAMAHVDRVRAANAAGYHAAKARRARVRMGPWT